MKNYSASIVRELTIKWAYSACAPNDAFEDDESWSAGEAQVNLGPPEVVGLFDAADPNDFDDDDHKSPAAKSADTIKENNTNE